MKPVALLGTYLANPWVRRLCAAALFALAGLTMFGGSAAGRHRLASLLLPGAVLLAFVWWRGANREDDLVARFRGGEPPPYLRPVSLREYRWLTAIPSVCLGGFLWLLRPSDPTPGVVALVPTVALIWLGLQLLRGTGSAPRAAADAPPPGSW